MQFNKYHDKFKGSNNQVHNGKHMALQQVPYNRIKELQITAEYVKLILQIPHQHETFQVKQCIHLWTLECQKKGTLEETSNSIIGLETMTDMKKMEKIKLTASTNTRLMAGMMMLVQVLREDNRSSLCICSCT